jgi:hypothetical protein
MPRDIDPGCDKVIGEDQLTVDGCRPMNKHFSWEQIQEKVLASLTRKAVAKREYSGRDDDGADDLGPIRPRSEAGKWPRYEIEKREDQPLKPWMLTNERAMQGALKLFDVGRDHLAKNRGLKGRLQ